MDELISTVQPIVEPVLSLAGISKSRVAEGHIDRADDLDGDFGFVYRIENLAADHSSTRQRHQTAFSKIIAKVEEII